MTGHSMGGFAGGGPHHSMGGFFRGGPHVSMGQRFGHGLGFGHDRFLDHNRFAGRPFFDHDRFVDHRRFVDRDRFFDHNRFVDRRFFDHNRFFHNHRNIFIFDFDFAAFGFPWWYPYAAYYPQPYYGPPYDYSYNDYGPTYDYQYWNNLAVSVQSELARRGYYQGPLDGVIGSDSRQAIRAFQAAQGLPVTGVIDPKLLDALGISYKRA
jgi:putative peptidoglycan binding protein